MKEKPCKVVVIREKRETMSITAATMPPDIHTAISRCRRSLFAASICHGKARDIATRRAGEALLHLIALNDATEGNPAAAQIHELTATLNRL